MIIMFPDESTLYTKLIPFNVKVPFTPTITIAEIPILKNKLKTN
jgi:hypothetical protein